MVFLRILVMVVAVVLCSSKVFSFGLKTHIWIAGKIFEDIEGDCSFELANVATRLDSAACHAIRSHKNHFMAGSLGPDVFPDLITGQVTVHPGLQHGWQTADFLKHLLNAAQKPEEIAFAYGYLVHAASDTFAHTYVNGYSGDVFALGDERAVELRHFVLEKYIDSKLPPSTQKAALASPETFLSRQQILNKDAANASLKSGLSLHISSMYGVYESVKQTDKALEGIEDIVGELIAKIIAEKTTIASKLADGELALKAAEETLRVNEQLLEAQQKLLDGVHYNLQKAINDLDKNRELISTYTLQAELADKAISESRRVASDANKAIADINGKLIQLRKDIRNVPDKICSTIPRTCRRLCPVPYVCDLVCKPSEVMCEVNKELTKLQNKILSFEQELNRAQSKLAQAGIDEAANTAKKANNLQKKAAEEALTAGFEVAKTSAQASYEVQRLSFEAQHKLTKEARKSVRKLREEVAELRKKLIDKESIETAIRDILDKANFISFYTKNWVKGIEEASDEYIAASMRVGQGMIEGKTNVVDEYGRWLSCYGGAFTPVPYQAGKWPCDAQSKYEELQSEIDSFIVRTLPPPFDKAYNKYLNVRKHIKNQVKEEVTKAGIELIKVAAPDKTTGDFIELLVKPEYATASKLHEVFSKVGDADGKKLLVFDDIVSNINADMGLTGGILSPDYFTPLSHALTLSKLALLDYQASARLVYELGGDPGLVNGDRGQRYSVLFEMLRSIDGSHQWQPYGIMFGRSDGKHQPFSPADRRWGYGTVDGPGKGMPHFANASMRELVFKPLFSKPVSGELAKHPALKKLPFRECKSNPFPVTFNDDGSPRQFDDRCTTLLPEYKKTGWDSIKIFLRRFGLMFGFPRFTNPAKVKLPDSCAETKTVRKRRGGTKIVVRSTVIDYSACSSYMTSEGATSQ